MPLLSLHSRLLVLMLLALVNRPLSAQPAPSPSDAPTTYVFVHGAFGGSWEWQEVAARLRAAGHKAYRPSLTGLGERVHLARQDVDLDLHVQDVVNALRFEDLTDVVLVGHSYGGMVITGVAERVPERIARLVYVDALLPKDGESVADLVPHMQDPVRTLLADAIRAYETGEGWEFSLPGEVTRPREVAQPMATFAQPLTLESEEAAALPGTYVLTIEPEAERDDFSHFAERARARGWAYVELPTGHRPQQTMPQELVDILLFVDHR